MTIRIVCNPLHGLPLLVVCGNFGKGLSICVSCRVVILSAAVSHFDFTQARSNKTAVCARSSKSHINTDNFMFSVSRVERDQHRTPHCT